MQARSSPFSFPLQWAAGMGTPLPCERRQAMEDLVTVLHAHLPLFLVPHQVKEKSMKLSP